MRKLKKLLALVLAVCVAFSVMSVGIFANAASDDFIKIMYVDSGRKYFTKDWLVALVKEAAADGYTHVELAIGNDGFRMLLDDMSLVVDGVIYSNDDVTAGIKAGNKAYYDNGEFNELTESEMDEIIAAAKSAGVEIIPLINTPGHMDAILDCMEHCGINGSYNGSARTVDITNTTAVNFTKALLRKYINYFAKNGSTIFDMGADEFANDIYSSGGMGFGNLISTGKYNYFVDYVNDVAAMIKAAGMAPMAFNDGIYYASNTSYGTFDTDIIISYWSSGWGGTSGYNVASASFLAGKGFPMINTNGDYYYILGVNDAFTPGTTTSHTDANAYTNASGFTNTTFMGSTVSNPAGSRFCVWSDLPGAETETVVASNLRLIMRAMALRMADQSISGMDTASVVVGGFNADGTINIPEIPTVTDTNTGVSVKAEGVADLAVSEKEAADISGAENVQSFEITPKDENGAKFTDAAQVVLPVPSGWNTDRIRGYVVNADGSVIRGLKGKVENGKFTFTVPHFSEIGQYTLENGVTDATVTIGGTAEFIVDGHIGTDGETGTTADGKASYTIEHITTEIPGESGWKLVTNGVNGIESGKRYVIVNSSSDGTSRYALTATGGRDTVTVANGELDASTIAEDAIFTLDGSDGSFTLKDNNGTYLYPTATYTSSWIGGSWSRSLATQQSTPQAVTISGTSSVTFVRNVVSDSRNTNSYIAYRSNNYTAYSSGTNLYIYEEVNTPGSTEYSTKITLTGISEGEDQVTIGDTTYIISVVPFDPSTVSPIKIEYWITNTITYDDSGSNSVEYALTHEGMYSENGLSIKDLAPEYTHQGSATGNQVRFVLARLLDRTKTNTSTSGEEEQTTEAGDDETASGYGVTRVRFWENAWSVYNDAEGWKTVNMNNYQLVAYYAVVINVADELDVTAVDWGNYGDGTTGEWLDSNNYCSVSFQIVYEDKTTNPVATTADALKSKSIVYGYWSQGRGVGTIFLNQISDYQIFKVTAETGAVTATITNSNTANITKFSWDSNEKTVWESEEASDYVKISNPANGFSTESPYDNLAWNENKEAILIRVYVKTVATEDSLTVHYVDESVNAEFYNYNISVNSGVLFDEGFALQSNGNLVNNSVVNINNVTQTVTTDLSTMTEIGEAYRYSSYTVTKATRSEDGKHVYLYYVFNNTHSFVADFGLPLKLTTDDIDAQIDWNNIVLSRPNYGTAVADKANSAIIYTPTKFFAGVETFTFTSGSATHNIYIYPATSVYYEESFATYDSNWSAGGTAVSGYQNVAVLGEDTNNYGYDDAYAGVYENSYMASAEDAASASFTFTGRGVDIFVNSKTDSGAMSVTVRRADGTVAKLIMVQTKAVNGESSTTSGQDVNPYGMVAASVEGLDYGTYTVYINNITSYGSYKEIRIDGFRVHGVLADETAYDADGEKNPTVEELRDQVLAGINVTKDTSEQYAEQIAKDLAQVYSAIGTTPGAIILSNTDVDAQDLLDNGPKNEIFLQSGQSITFRLADGVTAQIGLRAPVGAASYSVNNGSAKDLTSAVDMFYEGNLSDRVVITNEGNTVISITEIKAFGGAGNIFAAVDTAAVSLALEAADYASEANAADDVTTDMDGNGEVDVRDMIRFKKYASEQDVEINVLPRATDYVEDNTASILTDIRTDILFGE